VQPASASLRAPQSSTVPVGFAAASSLRNIREHREVNAADVCRNCAVLAKKRIRNMLLKMGAERLVRLDGEMESAVESETGSC
jgi:hypothetical protein